MYEQKENKDEFWNEISKFFHWRPYFFDFVSCDDQPWRQMLFVEFQDDPVLQNFVKDKRRILTDLHQFALEVLVEVPTDVVQYCVNCYI